MGQVTLNYNRLHRLELESVTKHVAQTRICTVISLPRQSDAHAGSIVICDRRHGVHRPGGSLMGKVRPTLNYGIMSETTGGGQVSDATKCDHSLSLLPISLRPITSSIHKTICRP